MPDLTDVPGITEFWTHTKGDCGIKIAILDGLRRFRTRLFCGGKYTQIKSYWIQDIELNE
ncbi:MAG: hypothetical protein C6Y22_16250 [Hapalosiphonaceae cyanobacterium JJU2]|nr:MAG: hypothetical protein C6Y22_16250 [Hapalosiphonaceae cyanobacterium JJU2]